MKKRAQAWGFDVTIGAIIFTLGIVVFFFYSLNYPRQSEETLDRLQFEGDFIAQSLLSTGSPDNWKQDNVASIGLTNENKINQTKLETLCNLVYTTQEGYNKAKSLFNTRYEFFFNFTKPIEVQDCTIPNPENGAGIGKNYVREDTKNLIKITRLTVYQDQPTTLQVYIWE